jgi:hypothetical protein
VKRATVLTYRTLSERRHKVAQFPPQLGVKKLADETGPEESWRGRQAAAEGLNSALGGGTRASALLSDSLFLKIEVRDGKPKVWPLRPLLNWQSLGCGGEATSVTGELAVASLCLHDANSIWRGKRSAETDPSSVNAYRVERLDGEPLRRTSTWTNLDRIGVARQSLMSQGYF